VPPIEAAKVEEAVAFAPEVMTSTPVAAERSEPVPPNCGATAVPCHTPWETTPSRVEPVTVKLVVVAPEETYKPVVEARLTERVVVVAAVPVAKRKVKF